MFSSEPGLAGRMLQWQDWHLSQMLCHPDQLRCCLPIANRSPFLPDCTPRGGRHWSQLIWAPARSSAVPGQGISPTQIHGVSSSSDGIPYSLFPNLAFLPRAYTAKDVSVQSREQGEGSGVWLWELSMWQLLWVGRRSSGWEEVPLAGSLHPLSLVAPV